LWALVQQFIAVYANRAAGIVADREVLKYVKNPQDYLNMRKEKGMVF
jgi:hypothetical protein